jgi:hypothetical protein
MSANYDSSTVGLPYVRITNLVINYPDVAGSPVAAICQSNAVTMADDTTRNLDVLQSLVIPIDLTSDGSTPIPLVDPVTGAGLGTTTTLDNVFLQILAVIRQAQVANNPPATNYSANAVGVLYVRTPQLVINWPDSTGGLPTAIISQSNAVVLVDGSVRHLDVLSPITITLDLVNNGTAVIPLVDPTTGVSLGTTTNLDTVYLNVLAVIRQAQVASG